jgi:2,4-dienoyl-CoA reductase-like NADH-dependent reductase (Old Yellow Enzyme family)/thioredoxin reductase
LVNAFETFPHLISPLKIGNLLFRNRMFASPVNSAEVIYDGQPSLEAVAYFERKAMGGAAAITYGEVDVDPEDYREGRYPREITRTSNYNYARLASAIRRQGAVSVLELCFSGIHARMYTGGGKPAWGPVDMTPPRGGKVAAMPEEKILQIIDEFGNAAFAAKNADFDMICLHGAHGFGLQQFMSPTINTRTDRWGGNPENRCRFEEGCRIAEQLDGHADIIHVSVGAINRFGAETFSRTHVSMFYPSGVNVEYAAEVKKHVKKSLVGTVGGLSDPYQMEQILASGKADIIYMGRELVCDPEFPNKVWRGCIDEIRKCMRCLNCFSEGVRHGDLICAINPEIGREREVYRALPTPEKQRVLVIGGGIAGMQAALTASKNGHDVVLCEKNGELGGKILCEAEVPFKQGLHDYILLQRVLITKSNIDLRLNTEVTPEYAQTESPDVIIAAVGSDPVTPGIPGINGSNVYQAIDVYKNPSLIKGRVVILGAGFVGTELAIYLKDFGIDAEIVEMLGDISDGGNTTHKSAVIDMITQKNIPIHFNTKAVEITGDGVKCQSPDGETFYEADAVIHAVGMRPLHDEALKFSRYAKDFHMIGECRKAANILYATSTAYAASRLIGRF